MQLLSPILYSVYVDNLIIILSDSKIGSCIIMNTWDFSRMQMISVYYVIPFLEHKKNVTDM